MKKVLLFIVMFTLLVGVSGCANTKGEEFIGFWENSKKASETLEIKRNDKNYIVLHTYKNWLTGKTVYKEYPAVLKETDNVLEVNKESNNLIISYIKEDKTLLMAGDKYIKKEQKVQK